MEKIRTRDDMMGFLAEAKETAEKYGWMDRKTHPYPHIPMTVAEILEECSRYDECDRGSKAYLRALADGLRYLMEGWVEYQLQPKIMVRDKRTGLIMEVTEEFAEIFDDLVEAV